MNPTTLYVRAANGERRTGLSPARVRSLQQILDRVVWACLWAVSIPQLIPVFGDAPTNLRILPVLGVAGTLGALLSPRTTFRNWGVYWPLLFLGAVTFGTALNTAVGNSWEGGLRSLYLIASGVSIYCMVVATVTTRRRFIQLSVLVIAGALVTAISFILENYLATSFTGLPTDQVSVNTGFLANRNWLAAYVICGLVSAFSLLESQRRWWQRVLLILSVVALFLGAFFTGSRGTAITTACLLGLWFIGANPKRLVSRALAFAFMLTVLLSLQNLAIVSYTFERLTLSQYEEVVQERRFELIIAAIDIWRENILFGGGLGAVMSKTGSSAHMAFTGLLAETGVLGFTLFYLPGLFIAAKTFRLSRSRGQALTEQQKILRIGAMGLFVFLLYSAFSEIYFIKNYYVYVGLLSAAAYARWPVVRSTQQLSRYEHAQNYPTRPYPLSRDRPF